jgi:aryl-alcohol dehydrogenase-like predicted oxidoreductase
MDFQLLGKTGLRVSDVALGAMTFGEEWGWGANKEDSRRIFDAYVESGGNFIDTADGYTNGTSERMVGEFTRGQRERFVIATKYTFSSRQGDPNSGGNHRKNMMQALDGSLKRLGMDYVDLYWVHAWDRFTPVEEMMRGLDDLVRARKILYVGISDAPAWVVSYANATAHVRDWSPFVALQIEYSLLERTPERELIPMARALGLTVTPWSPLAGGMLAGKYTRGSNVHEGRLAEHPFADFSDRNFDIVDVVKSVAAETGATPSQVSLAWVRQKGTIPILGARTLAQLKDNLASLDVKLNASQIERLEKISAIAPGFPGKFLNRDFVLDRLYGGTFNRIRGREA